MPDELLMTLATTLAMKGAEAAVAGGRDAVAALVRLVRARFGHGTPEAGVLAAAVDQPDDVERQARLASLLAEAMRQDPVFAAALQRAWTAAAAEIQVGNDGVLNQFSGSADKVVQARDIAGGITF